MPLVSLKTDLKSLRFKSSDIPGDRPGGGWSREPFVTLRKDYIDRLQIEDLRKTGGEDWLVRGGALLPGRILKDEERLAKFLNPFLAKGAAFTTQQNLLSISGVRTFAGYPENVRFVNLNKANDGTYTPLSTLASAAGIALGGHPNKQGIDFTGQNDLLSRPQYMNLVKGGIYNTGNNEGITEAKNNRLFNLYANKIVGVPLIALNAENPALGQLGDFLTNNKLIRGVVNFVNKNVSNPENLYAYLGGPQAGSNGLGKTYIKIGGDSPSRQYGGDVLVGNNIETSTRAFQNSALKFSTFSQAQIASFPAIKDGSTIVVNDFRENLNVQPKSFVSKTLPYSKFNIEQRVNLGDPGIRVADRSNFQKGLRDNLGRKINPGGLDKVNALYLYKSSAVTTNKVKNDLVKFRIATILNDDPQNAIFAHFRAYINSFTDTMNASWNSFKYAGRGEDFYTYQGFNNSISMGFTVVAQSIEELSIMYQKLNYLKSTLAPNYSDNGYMRGNLHRLTIGGYFYEVPGIIDNLTYTIPNDTTWEIGIPATVAGTTNAAGSGTGITDSKVKELPHRIEVSMSFKPIYKFLPETVKDINGGGEISQRFISLEDADGKVTNNLYADTVGDQFRVPASSVKV